MTQTKHDNPELIPFEILDEAAGCLRTVAHPHRLRMIQLMLHGEFTVGELAEACGIPSHMASEHLGKMRDRGLLESERRGRRTYYKILAEGLSGIMDCIRSHFGA